MRTSILSLTFGLSVASLMGCGDDDSSTPADARIDAKPVDAPPDAPRVFKGFDADEGGEIRAEYVRFANGNAGTRTPAFFFKNPGPKKFFPFLNLNGCTDLRDKNVWPVATNLLAERVYADPGMVTITGGTSPLVVPRNPAASRDQFFRQHQADKWFFDPVAGTHTDGPTFLPEKTLFDVTLAGSADMPAQTFQDVLYMPADFLLTTSGGAVQPYPILDYPLTSNATATTPNTIDHTFTWQTPDNAAPAGFRVDSFVAFTGPNGPVVVCLEPDDGSITVPAAFVTIARTAYPTGGTLARQKLTHVVRELVDNTGPTGRRIDFIAVWCYATSFSVPPATAP